MTGTTVGKMAEVFPSIQGEGYQVGVMQLFLRLAGCNLKCPSCDTPHSWESEERFSLWPWPGRKAVQMANPVSPGELFETLGKAYPLRDFHSISFTGGEPLHQPDFVRELGLLFFHNGNRISMQTNGTLPDAISGLESLVSFWNVDLKVSRSWGVAKKIRKAQERFIARLSPDRTYLKIVLDPDDDPRTILEFFDSNDLSNFRIVLQPFSNNISHVWDWDYGLMLEWLQLLGSRVREIRWIPQVHKLLRIL